MSGYGAWRWYWLAKGAKNITAYFKLTRSCGDCWPSCPILPLINKIKIVSDIGWSPAISAWDCHLIHGNDTGLLSTAAMKCLYWSLFCKKILSENFWTNLLLQKDEFSKCIFQWGPLFFRTSFPYTEGCAGPAIIHIKCKSTLLSEEDCAPK